MERVGVKAIFDYLDTLCDEELLAEARRLAQQAEDELMARGQLELLKLVQQQIEDQDLFTVSRACPTRLDQ